MRQLHRLAAAGLLLALATAGAATLPDFTAVRAAHRPSDLVLTDRQGEPIQTLRVDDHGRRGAWVALSEVSPALRAAILVSEDRRFWDHAGVDWPALAAGAWASAWNTRTRGASTVTMQLAGMLDAELRRPAGGRSLPQKLGQIAAAHALEARWRKSEILEAYLNLVPLRGEAVGLMAGAVHLFGKHPSGLDAIEAALLAALVRAPNAPATELARRACTVWRAMARSEQAPCAAVHADAARMLERPAPAAIGDGPVPRSAQLAPHFARYWVGTGAGPGGTRTTLDARLQRVAVAALRRQLAELNGREVDDGAVLVLHNASGEVRAWVGSASGGGVDAVLARRQPGSTLKPFVYGLAFERGFLTPESLLEDAPLHLLAGADAYQPQNYDRRWRGWVSAHEALAASLNVPAVRVAAMLGPDAVFDALTRHGLRPRESAGFHGHALALGSAEVTLLDLANAYRGLANGGRHATLAQPGRPAGAPHSVLRREVAEALTTILADNAARAGSFGFDNPLRTRRPAAVKTGTSKDLRDNWCIGFTAEHTVAVWLGNASGAPMHGVSGVSGAAPVWREVVEALPAERATLKLAPHALAGRALAHRAASAPERAREAFAISPIADGSVLAFDPDIPAAAQQLHLQGPRGHWRIDGASLGHGERVRWALRPGRHVLELHDERGRLLQRLRFTVRPGVRPRAVPGASPRQPLQTDLPLKMRSTAASITTPITL